LPELYYVDLADNTIAVLTPLVNNLGLGEYDELYLSGNSLDLGDCGDIDTLEARGASVDYDGFVCP